MRGGLCAWSSRLEEALRTGAEVDACSGGCVVDVPGVQLVVCVDADCGPSAGNELHGIDGTSKVVVGVIRTALDAAGHDDTVILAYAVKYSSAFCGPFREAVVSSLVGDRKTYQQDPANARDSIREVELDIAEGADIVMPSRP